MHTDNATVVDTGFIFWGLTLFPWLTWQTKFFLCTYDFCLYIHSKCSVVSLGALLSHSVVSHSLQPHELQPAKLLCSWGFLQARVLEWVAKPSSGGLPNSGTEPRSPALQADSLPAELPGEPWVWVKVKVKVMSDSLRPRGLYSPWNSLDQNTGKG